MSKKIFSFYWNALEKFGSQIVRFVLGIVLARILSPRDYGLIGLLIVFTAISQIFVDSGFSKALMQKNDKNPSDVNTAFTFNLIVSLSLYLLLFITAPLIAHFYEEVILVQLLRVLALTLIINALFAIPNTILAIDLDFKKIAVINFTSIVISGIVAILLAIMGFGVWALVLQYLLKSILTTVLFWLSKAWSPKLFFSKTSFKRLFKFGINITLSSLLNEIVEKFSWLFIAKSFSTSDLGYYNRGIQFPDTAIGTLGSVLDSVLLPNLAKIKGDVLQLKEEVSRLIRFLSLITILPTVLLAVLAEPVVILLLTNKWIAAAPILSIFCFCRFTTNLSTISINLLYTINKSNLVLRQQYWKMGIRIVLILLALKFGIVYVALAELISVIIHFIIGAYYPGKIINFGAVNQIRQILPFLIIGLFEFIALSYLMSLFDSQIVKISIVCAVGLFLHIVLVYFFKKEDYIVLKGLLFKLIGK